MQAFGVFEGGGLRGYAHIGALRAIEKRGIEFEQVAGTSIGAVVAALVAAGFTADEIYREENGKALGVSVVAFEAVFDRGDWNAIRRLSRDMRDGARFAKFLSAAVIPSPSGGYRGVSSPFKVESPLLAALGGWAFVPLAWIAAPFIYLRYRLSHASLWRDWGMVDASLLRAWLDKCLRQRLTDVPPDREIQFGDLKKPLRVVVADVQTGALKVLGDVLTAPIVDAVIASASVPFFFRPQRAMGAVLVDGGLLSNVPAWVFDRERLALPQCLPTLTFRLLPQSRQKKLVGSSTMASFVPRLIATALDGARALELRKIDDHHIIALDADIGILDFDRINEERSRLVNVGEVCTEKYFRDNLGPFDPIEAKRVLSAIAGFIKDKLVISGHVRAYAILPSDEEFLRTACAANMEEDGDEHILIRRSSIGPALAFARKEPVIITVGELGGGVRHNPLFKNEHACRPRKLTTICAVPFFAEPKDWLRDPGDRPEPMGVFVFDSEESIRLKLLAMEIEDLVATYAQFIGERLRRHEVREFDEVKDDAPDAGQFAQIEPGVEVYDRKRRSLLMDKELAALQSEISPAVAA